MNEITGIRFSDAWKNKRVEEIKRRKGKIKIYYIGLDELIRNKEALRRPKDLEDLKYLRKIKKEE
jgi:hypothetical protein